MAGDIINSGIVAGDLSNSGQIQSNAAVTVDADGTLTNQTDGQITSVAGTTITATAFDNQGQIGADTGTLAVSVTGDIVNAGTLFSGGTAALKLDGTLVNMKLKAP